MTTLASTPTAPMQQTRSVSRGRAGLIALWVTRVAVAGMIVLAGGLKLAGLPEHVALFDAIGVGQWFRYVTGSIEVVSGVALLVPSLAAFGALLLVPTMLGAIATHLFIVGGSAVPATVLLIGSLVIAWARRDRLMGPLVKLLRKSSIS